jgi:hypothetical protein
MTLCGTDKESQYIPRKAYIWVIVKAGSKTFCKKKKHVIYDFMA